MTETYPLSAAALAQIGATAVVGAIAFAMAHYAQADPLGIPLILAMLQGGFAAMIGKRQGGPPWWLAIHLAFAPLAVLVHGLDIDPVWFLAIFLLLLAIFWRTDKSRVPLYLTNQATATTIIELLPPGKHRVIDLGCGDGGLLRRLAIARPNCTFVGVEHAPLTWLIARLRTLGIGNITLRCKDFWDEPLSDYRLVYAFLSPTPMPQLWEKLQREMAPDALFVSNSFPVPNLYPERIVKVTDRRATRLYLYRYPAVTSLPDKAGDSVAFPTIPTPCDQE